MNHCKVWLSVASEVFQHSHCPRVYIFFFLYDESFNGLSFNHLWNLSLIFYVPSHIHTWPIGVDSTGWGLLMLMVWLFGLSLLWDTGSHVYAWQTERCYIALALCSRSSFWARVWTLGSRTATSCARHSRRFISSTGWEMAEKGVLQHGEYQRDVSHMCKSVTNILLELGVWQIVASILYLMCKILFIIWELQVWLWHESLRLILTNLM
jgi:hypothetical protein